MESRLEHIRNWDETEEKSSVLTLIKCLKIEYSVGDGQVEVCVRAPIPDVAQVTFLAN